MIDPKELYILIYSTLNIFDGIQQLIIVMCQSWYSLLFCFQITTLNFWTIFSVVHVRN